MSHSSDNVPVPVSNGQKKMKTIKFWVSQEARTQKQLQHSEETLLKNWSNQMNNENLKD